MSKELTQDCSAEIGNPDTEIQDVCEEITGTLEAAFDLLIERKDAAYSAAVEPLDKEAEQLAQESAAISEDARNLEELLPAKVRVSQSEHDRLLLAGDREGAAAKLAEQQEAEAVPAAVSRRQREIDARVEAIESEKRAIKSRIFQTWYGEMQTVIRAVERGFFIVLLDGLSASLFEFEPHAATNVNVLANLTAPERSEEWQAGIRWYGRR
jgi:hypothetical protein